jgi:hypothetical protein
MSESNLNISEVNCALVSEENTYDLFEKIRSNKWKCLICESDQKEKFLIGYKSNLEDHLASCHKEKARELNIVQRIRSKRPGDTVSGEGRNIPLTIKIRLDVNINEVCFVCHMF